MFSGGSNVRPAEGLEIRPWVWWVLALTAFGLRAACVSLGHPAFDSDEALDFDYLRQWSGAAPPDGLGPASGARAGGLRLFLGALAFKCLPGCGFAPSYLACALSVLGALPWILYLDRAVSRRAALFAAVAFTFAPGSLAYYGTMYQRRLFTQIFGGVLVLFCGRWMKSRHGALLLGLLAGWAFFEEFLSAFIALPVLAFEIHRLWRERKAFAGRVIFLAAGLLIGGAYGAWFYWKGGDLDPTATSFGWASWEATRFHARMLVEVFPRFLNGAFPFGNLQYSSLGQAVDPIPGAGWGVFWGAWTLALTGAAGWGLARRRDDGRGDEILPPRMLLIPTTAYLAFFILSAQVTDMRSFRYLSFVALVLCLGFALTAEAAAKRTPRRFGWLLAVWIGVNGGGLAWRLSHLPQRSAFQVVEDGLSSRGIRAGYANSWVSEGLRYLSGGRVLLSPTNVPPVSRKAYAAAHQDARVALVLVDSMDPAGKTSVLLGEIIANGYRPVGRWRTAVPGWSFVEFERESGKAPIEGRRPNG